MKLFSSFEVSIKVTNIYFRTDIRFLNQYIPH